MRLRPVRRWLGDVKPERRSFKQDLLAGLPDAIGAVPDGMAAGVLAGVNPVHGLYASFAGPIAGGLSTSTKLMVITTTSASALAAGSALEHVDVSDRPHALALLTLLAGVVMVAAGLARLGRYTLFVSHSVMIGFLTGIAVNIVLGQLGDLTGVPAQGSTNLAKAYDVITHPSEIQPASLLIGLSALALLVLLARTRLALGGALMALAIPTAAVLIFGLDDVAQVNDAGGFPQGIPLPQLPELHLLSFSLVSGAFAVAAIILVQGAGVAEAAANEDGSPSDANRDFIAQGAGNLSSGLFTGQPVGASVGQTALNMTAGARTRWASICAGLWMVLVLVAFAGIVGQVALPTLAAVLIYAGIRSLRPRELQTIMRTGPPSRIAVLTTFFATLFLPVTAAVGIGVALSLLLQLNQEAMDLAVVRLEPREDGRFVEHPGPHALHSHEAMLLDVYGSLFYAGSRTLEARLPDPGQAKGSAIVLRLRGRTSLGSTFFKVIADYAARLAANGNRLYLSGMEPSLIERLRRTHRIDPDGPVQLYEATDVVGESSDAAYHDAQAWVVSQGED